MTTVSLAHCEALTYLRDFGDNVADLIITDPPYGVLDTKDCSWDKDILDWAAFGKEFFRVLKPGGQVFMYSSWQLWFHLMSLREWKKNFYYEIILNRKATFAAPYKKRPANVHEYGLVFKKGSKPVYFDPAPLGIIKAPYIRQNHDKTNRTNKMDTTGIRSNCSGLRKPITVIETRRKSCMPKRLRTKHPTQKDPVTMMNIIDSLSPEGSLIIDPFFGSGTVFVAAIMSDRCRRVFGCEINKEYYDAAHKHLRGLRLEQHYTAC
jgi:DNA modification methylase